MFMGTDKQIYSIFVANPEWIFLLTGLPSPGRCRMQSVSFKSLEVTTDCLIVPDDDEQSLVIVEFQFQLDVSIYGRTVIAMALAQKEHGHRPVRGIILFRDGTIDPDIEPWNRVVDRFNFADLIEDFGREHPDHPLFAVFQPVLMNDDDKLETEAIKYFRAIRDSAVADDIRSTLLNVFVDWLEQRFRHKSKQEIEAMLITDFPDLRDTRSGQDLIEIGRQEGRQEGLQEGLGMLRATSLRLLQVVSIDDLFE